jgi:hypothetical protein
MTMLVLRTAYGALGHMIRSRAPTLVMMAVVTLAHDRILEEGRREAVSPFAQINFQMCAVDHFALFRCHTCVVRP